MSHLEQSLTHHLIVCTCVYMWVCSASQFTRYARAHVMHEVATTRDVQKQRGSQNPFYHF